MNENKLTLDEMYKAVFFEKQSEKLLHFGGDSVLKSNNIFNSL
jgi:hypothetical protein